MAYQNMINKNKNVGTVIFIVEGEVKEFQILKHIFNKILGYNYVSLGKDGLIKESYISKDNNSEIIVANTSNSNISSINKDDYLSKIRNTLLKELNRNIKYAKIYYVWDCDQDSNKTKVVKELLETLDDDIVNGKLILSYPCIEVYELSNYDKRLHTKEFVSAKEAKSALKNKKIKLKHINETTLLTAYNNMITSLKNYQINEFKYPESNIKVFNKEEEYFKDYHKYQALSLVSYILYDLEILI